MIREISSRKNPVVAQTEKICKSPSAENFVMQGDKFISDAARAHPETFIMLFTTDTEKYGDIIALLPPECQIFAVTQPVMDRLSQSVSESSLLAVMRKHMPPRPDSLIILDGVQDPGNVGTVIRTAHCFGFGVVCGDDCANPFSAKAVRSTAGAILGCYAEKRDLKTYIPELKNDGYFICGSALSEKAESLPDADIPCGRRAVIVGSEGRGVSAQVLALTDKVLYIPIKNVESLNAAVAASIFTYALSL